MIAILTEKPSVAKDIARILNVSEKKDGYMSGSGYLITWAYGHLVTLAMPEAYGKERELPIQPDPFRLVPRQEKAGSVYKPDVVAVKQLETIRQVFDRAEQIIVATDAGREGELIFRYIYSYLKCEKPFYRLWISSLTDEAIQAGMENLRRGCDFDNLYLSAKARSEADWLVGINASQALRVTSGESNSSLGRVQTPTLALICARYLEHTQFESTPYYELSIGIIKEGSDYTCKGLVTFENKEEAENCFKKVKTFNLATALEVSIRDTLQEAPLLFDLTSLQKEANRRYGFSADQTLKMAQKLYERKYISYPRTGSRHITRDMFPKVPALIRSLSLHPQFGEYVAAMNLKTLPKKAVHDKKVTDHHALLITGNIPERLYKDEQRVYDLIAGRVLESFSPSLLKEITNVQLICEELSFELKGEIIKEKGWRKVWNLISEEEQYLFPVPLFQQGEEVTIKNCNLVEKMRKPKALYTDASLLSAMEHAGKDVTDEEARKAMTLCGLGTPATRAGIIETLISRNYISRRDKSLEPTQRGLRIYQAVRNMRIADVGMTGAWEASLRRIEKDPEFLETFMTAIGVHTRQITEEILSVQMPVVTDCEEAPVCPKCRKARITMYHKVAKCRDTACGFKVFRKLFEKHLTEAQILTLLNKGKTTLVRGFRKDGNSVDGYISFTQDFRPYLTVCSIREKKK